VKKLELEKKMDNDYIEWLNEEIVKKDQELDKR